MAPDVAHSGLILQLGQLRLFVGCSPAIKSCPRRGPQWFNFVGKTTQAFRGSLIGGGETLPAIKRCPKREPQRICACDLNSSCFSDHVFDPNILGETRWTATARITTRRQHGWAAWAWWPGQPIQARPDPNKLFF